MHKSIKIVTVILLLVQIVVLSSCSFGRIMSYITGFPLCNMLISKILAISEVKPPDIPDRPSLDKLRKSLDDVVLKSNFLLQDNIRDKAIVENYAVQHSSESTTVSTFQFNRSPDLLFSDLIELVMPLKLSVKSLDVTEKEIILLDAFRNKIVINVTSNNTNSLIKIIGYKSIFGAWSYKKTINSLLGEITKLESRINT